MDELLTLREAALELRVDRRTLMRELEAGTLVGLRVGARGQWRISRAALDDYAARGSKVQP